MTMLTHQVEELTRAISQVVNTESLKARIEVMKIIDAGVENKIEATKILVNILEWCREGNK
jgi:hypothetical protein